MRLIYILAKFYPFWTLPLAVVLFDLFRYFRRMKNKRQHYCLVAITILLFTNLLWFGFRGDINSDRWVSRIFRVED